MKLPPLPTVSQIVKLYGLSARQQLSQNFIMDLNVCGRIVRSCGQLENSVALEVGAGPGNLTRALLTHGCRHVIAVEKDPRFLPALEMLREAAGPDRLTIAMGDALTMNEAELLRQAGAEARPWDDPVPAPVHIVGNLPFSVSTELLLKWVRQIPERTGAFAFGRVSLTLLFQKEVAQRIYASPGTSEWSRLSVMTQHCALAHKRLDLTRKCFVPVPEVDAGVVSVIPRIKPAVKVRLPSLEYVLRQVFGQRRKMTRNSVDTLTHGAEILAESGVDGTLRPDQLTLQQWAALANAFDTVHARLGTHVEGVTDGLVTAQHSLSAQHV